MVLAKTEHSIQDYVDGDLLHGVVYHSLSARTKEMAVYCSMIGAVAAVCAEKCCVSLGEGHKVHSCAINLLIVGKPGSGKSSAIDNFCINQVNKIHRASGMKKFYCSNPASFAGMLLFEQYNMSYSRGRSKLSIFVSPLSFSTRLLYASRRSMNILTIPDAKAFMRST